MAGYIKVDVERFETQQINMQINAEVFVEFQKRCKQRNIPMNVVIEAFASQYARGRYPICEENILKWKNNNDEVSVLNTPINKTIYYQFKNKVKADKYFVKHVLTAFIEDFAKNDLLIEFVRHDIAQ